MPEHPSPLALDLKPGGEVGVTRTSRIDNVRYLIEILLPHPKGLPRRDAITGFARLRRAAGEDLPPTLEKTVQSCFNGHNSGSPEFARRRTDPRDDLFYPVGRKGSGVWAVHADRAREWLRRNGY